ncbi:GatB/YqeY domain-containing protein [candidate division KSB1 bacterium]|nr:GatB/YqeY domain-containing protein [candidate division KSB1 bacterium]
MSIYEKLTEDMKTALKAGQKDRLSTIRLLRGQLKNAEIDKQDALTEQEEIEVLSSAAKKRRESIDSYTQAGRDDLADKEQKELDVITEYLPKALSEKEVKAIVDRVIAEQEAVSMKDLGKVMPKVMAEVKGRAEGKVVNEMVRNKLA